MYVSKAGIFLDFVLGHLLGGTQQHLPPLTALVDSFVLKTDIIPHSYFSAKTPTSMSNLLPKPLVVSGNFNSFRISRVTFAPQWVCSSHHLCFCFPKQNSEVVFWPSLPHTLSHQVLLSLLFIMSALRTLLLIFTAPILGETPSPALGDLYLSTWRQWRSFFTSMRCKSDNVTKAYYNMVFLVFPNHFCLCCSTKQY